MAPATFAPASARRIFITGQGGSGKSTLARQLGLALDLPVWLFDDIAYDPQTHRRRPNDLRLAAVERLTAQPAWVVDCWYMGWTDPLLRCADLIVWLDFPWRVAAWRILRRHILADLRGDNPHPGLRRLFRFLAGERKGYQAAPSSPDALQVRDGANNRATTARILAAYRGKVVHCLRPADVRAFRRRFP